MYKSDDSGQVHPFHMTHYTARAIGKVGLIIVEATGIEPRGRITDRDLGLWEDDQIFGHKALVDSCKAYGSKMALQLAHAGRKSECKKSTPVAPSALAFSPNAPYKMPKELSVDEIEDIKQSFINAAKRAQEARYDMIELHSAHGYLLFEFLSPLTNKRTDSYGGSLENRCRLTCEIATLIKQNVDIPLIVRISADEWMSEGWNVDDSIYLSQKLQKLGVDVMHISSGGNHLNPTNPPSFEPFYQCHYAKKIKQNIDIPVIAVGLITTGKQGEKMLEDGVCDLVAYGRELLRDANFCFQASKELQVDGIIDSSYARAYL
jgi:NADPH2 dehydrogenase